MDHHGAMSARAVLPALALAAALCCAACGSSGTTTSGPTSTGSTTTAEPPSTTPHATGPRTSVTAQPATTAPPGLGPASPLGSTQSVTTPEGHTLGVRVASVTQRSPGVVQVQVQLTADGPPSQVQPALDFGIVDSGGARHGASLTEAPLACPPLPATVTVTPQAPVLGCLVFSLPGGGVAAQVSFVADGAPASTAVAWRAS